MPFEAVAFPWDPTPKHDELFKKGCAARSAEAHAGAAEQVRRDEVDRATIGEAAGWLAEK